MHVLRFGVFYCFGVWSCPSFELLSSAAQFYPVFVRSVELGYGIDVVDVYSNEYIC